MQRIKDWPQEERPREKLLQAGAEALSDAELLALVLRTGDAASGHSAVDQARQLLARFGSLRRPGPAPATAELCQTKGIGPAKAAELLAVFELARRFAARTLAPGAATPVPTRFFATTTNGCATARRRSFSPCSSTARTGCCAKSRSPRGA